ncbi:hypothetical protein MY11210_007142 [Beauveria gryllotalpidicola]
MTLHRPQVIAFSGNSLLGPAYDGLSAVNKTIADLEQEYSRLEAIYLYEAREDLIPDRSALEEVRRDLFDQGQVIATAKAEMERVRRDLRHCIDTLSRPHLSNTRIVDLPAEILLRIFQLVEIGEEGMNADKKAWNTSIVEGQRGIKDIQNIRLTCRSLCNLSSGLLVRSVRAHFNETSLSRLEEISRHATISKGVRFVQLTFELYDSSLAELDAFSSYVSNKVTVQGVISYIRIARPDQLHDVCVRDLEPATAQLKRVAAVDAANAARISEVDQACRVRLEEIHRDYLELLQKQISLQDSERYSTVVCSAMARMPLARELTIGEYDTVLMRPPFDASKTNKWDALRWFLLQPVNGRLAYGHGQNLPSHEPILKVMEAVSNAGVLLKSLRICLSTLGWTDGWDVAPHRLRALSSAVQKLESFQFIVTHVPDEHARDDHHGVLSALLDTESLRTLYLELQVSHGSSLSVLEQILGSRPRPKLAHVALFCVRFGLSDLELLLDRMPQSLRTLHLAEVTLLTDTWADALDLLRQRECCKMELTYPHGAEVNDMNPDDYILIWQGTEQQRSQVEVYLSDRDEKVPNPLREYQRRLSATDDEIT